MEADAGSSGELGRSGDLGPLRQQLARVRAENARLEQRAARRAAITEQITVLEYAIQETRDELSTVQQKVEAETRRAGKMESTAQLRTDPARSSPAADADGAARSVELLRKRIAKMKQVLATCSDPHAPVREEESVKALAAQVKNAERSTAEHRRQMVQRTKQIEARRSALDAAQHGSHLVVHAAEEKEQKVQAYVARLNEAATSGREVADRSCAEEARLRGEWESWLAVLAGGARALQAKADAGDVPASCRLPPDTQSPAVQLLELVSTLGGNAAALRKRMRDCMTKEVALELKLKSANSKVTQQTFALKLAKGRLGGLRSESHANIAEVSKAAFAGAPAAASSLPDI